MSTSERAQPHATQNASRSYRAEGVLNASDVGRLLFTRRDVVAHDEPCLHGCIDNYLPDRVYDDLLRCFPDTTLRFNYGSDCRLEDDHAHTGALWSKSRYCRDLLTFFTSDTFLRDAFAFFRPALLRERGRCSRPWTYVNDWPAVPPSGDVTPTKVAFKFSRLTRGEAVAPHTDETCKLVSLVLHVAEPGWRESHGGGMDLYVPRSSLLRRNWSNTLGRRELMNPVRTLRFVPNRLVFLVKSSRSWHGVSPLTCPAGASRKSLLITIHDGVYRGSDLTHRVIRGIGDAVVRTLMRMEGHRT